ncbi:organic solute transporter Ostalpha-domain-containing protein [Xylariomycetidae sp. FL0641]|nr:organic solute transporter Ostalpha-domain-containing protein [Xylariomycetidae sp. FL0641]
MNGYLFRRGNEDSDDQQCLQKYDESPTDPIVGSLTFQQLAIIIGGACMVYTLTSVSALMFRHLRRLSRPREQVNILRLCLFLIVFSIVIYIPIVIPSTYGYIAPWHPVLETYALSHFYLFLCELLAPPDCSREEIFLTPLVIAKRKQQRGELKKRHGGGPKPKDLSKYYRVRWTIIYFAFPFNVLIAIVSDLANAAHSYCINLNDGGHGHIWLNLSQSFTVGAAFVCIVMSISVLSKELKPYKAVAKLIAFKMLIGLQVLQELIWWGLERADPSPLDPTATLNQADLQAVLPLLITSVELVIFSTLYHYAYSPTAYQLSSYTPASSDDDLESSHHVPSKPVPTEYTHHGGLRAIPTILSPRDMFAAIAFIFRVAGATRALDRRFAQENAAALSAQQGGNDNNSNNPFLTPDPSPRASQAPPDAMPSAYDAYQPNHGHAAQGEALAPGNYGLASYPQHTAYDPTTTTAGVEPMAQQGGYGDGPPGYYDTRQ